MNDFKLRKATLEDIDEIMKVEKASFISQIQEEKELFEKRIKCFPEGFIIFETEDENKNLKTAGYFCSERWQSIPESEEKFVIGHDIEKYMSETGKVLYVSSFAIMPEFRGGGNGKKLFAESIDFVKSECEKKSAENKIEQMVLMVNEIWKGAHHIYESYGFEKIFVLKKIFPSATGSATDGIVMKK